MKRRNIERVVDEIVARHPSTFPQAWDPTFNTEPPLNYPPEQGGHVIMSYDNAESKRQARAANREGLIDELVEAL